MKDLYKPTVCGKGYLGVGEYKATINKKMTKAYMKWMNMLTRCYNNSYKDKYPTYINCIVCEEWLNFQAFAQWFYDNYKESYVLDKDILIKGNKIYGPNTCCFIPQQINLLLTNRTNKKYNTPIGVYKLNTKFQAFLHKESELLYLGTYDTVEEAFNVYKPAKELYIKEIADKYKPTITPQCYEALYNYVVEITD